MPSFRAILWNDWPAFACSVGIAVMWALFFARSLLVATDMNAFDDVWTPLVATAILSGMLGWRIWRVHALFRSGTEVPGRVTAVRLVRDRGRLEFEFALDGRTASAWMPVHKSKRVLSIKLGQPVTVLMDPRKPSGAIIKELFL